MPNSYSFLPPGVIDSYFSLIRAERGTDNMSVVNEKVLIMNNLLFLAMFMKIKSHQGYNYSSSSESENTLV